MYLHDENFNYQIKLHKCSSNQFELLDVFRSKRQIDFELIYSAEPFFMLYKP